MYVILGAIAFIGLKFLCVISMDGSNHEKFCKLHFYQLWYFVYICKTCTHVVMHCTCAGDCIVKTSERTSTIFVLQVLSGIRQQGCHFCTSGGRDYECNDWLIENCALVGHQAGHSRIKDRLCTKQGKCYRMVLVHSP